MGPGVGLIISEASDPGWGALVGWEMVLGGLPFLGVGIPYWVVGARDRVGKPSVYRRKRNWGIVLTGIGAVSGATGIVFLGMGLRPREGIDGIPPPNCHS